MFINSINANLNQKLLRKTNTKSNSTSFHAGPNPVVAKNQMKILLAQDIWAPKLKVRMPESPLEKETVLEMLKQRLYLDRLARLTNERFEIMANVARYNELTSTNPNSEERTELGKELDKKGNLESYFGTINKQIASEKVKHRPAMEYFEDIAKLEDEYLSKKLLTEGKMTKFYQQVMKNNINKDNQYSTKELIEIIESGVLPTETQKVTETDVIKKASAPIIHNKKELLSAIEARYEFALRKMINVYTPSENAYELEVLVARRAVEEIFKDSIKKFPNLQTSIKSVYSSVEKRFIHKYNMLEKLTSPNAENKIVFYNLNNVWELMKPIETDLRANLKSLESLKAQLEKNPEDKKLKEQIEKTEATINKLKEEWLVHTIACVKYEWDNYNTLKEMGHEDLYNYLVNYNHKINTQVEAFKLYQENGRTIPNEYLPLILNTKIDLS